MTHGHRCAHGHRHKHSHGHGHSHGHRHAHKHKSKPAPLSDWLGRSKPEPIDDLVDRTFYGPNTLAGRELAARPWKPSHEKFLVLCSIKKDDTSWVKKANVPCACYVNDDPEAEFTVPKNRGNEAMAYVTYIIDNYDTIPVRVAFLHGHLTSWHVKSNLDYVNNVIWDNIDTYASFRCCLKPGCPLHTAVSKEMKKKKRSENIHRKHIEKWYEIGWKDLFEKWIGPCPDGAGAPCCAQFVMTGKVIRSYPKEFWIECRDWLLNTNATSRDLGTTFEYTWHIIAGKPHRWCPREKDCRKLVFGEYKGLDPNEALAEARKSYLPDPYPELIPIPFDEMERLWENQLLAESKPEVESESEQGLMSVAESSKDSIDGEQEPIDSEQEPISDDNSSIASTSRKEDASSREESRKEESSMLDRQLRELSLELHKQSEGASLLSDKRTERADKNGPIESLKVSSN